jgi:hypothetical protein
VIFIAKTYLREFLTTLPYVVAELNELNPWNRDRFLDSLYFVRVIHAIGKPVQVLPYELNYMTNFELEITQNTLTADAVLVHHLFDTEIFCLAIEEEPYCRSPLSLFIVTFTILILHL